MQTTAITHQSAEAAGVGSAATLIERRSDPTHNKLQSPTRRSDPFMRQ